VACVYSLLKLGSASIACLPVKGDRAARVPPLRQTDYGGSVRISKNHGLPYRYRAREHTRDLIDGCCCFSSTGAAWLRHLLLATTGCRAAAGHRPALLIERYSRYAEKEQSGEGWGGVSHLVRCDTQPVSTGVSAEGLS
jgi:hypothetical protein